MTRWREALKPLKASYREVGRLEPTTKVIEELRGKKMDQKGEVNGKDTRSKSATHPLTPSLPVQAPIVVSSVMADLKKLNEDLGEEVDSTQTHVKIKGV